MNEFKELTDYPKRYAKAVEVVSALRFVGQFFGFVVSDKTKSPGGPKFCRTKPSPPPCNNQI